VLGIDDDTWRLATKPHDCISPMLQATREFSALNRVPTPDVSRLTVTWETIGSVPLVNVRFKNCMGIESSRGKTVLRFTREQGESNKGTSTGVVPFDFPPGKYTLAVSDPANNIRGMTFVSILRPISVAEIIEPPWGMKNLSWRNTTWSRGRPQTQNLKP